MSTINIKEPSVVIREKRLGTINAFTGTASEIVEKSAKGELKDCKRKFSQTNRRYSCVHHRRKNLTRKCIQRSSPNER